MSNSNLIDIEITIHQPEEFTLRMLEDLRKDLHHRMLFEFADDEIDIHQEAASRSIDPVVIGTIGLALLPIMAEKAADVLTSWIESKNNCTVLLKIPVKGAEPIEVEYNPLRISPEKLRNWIVTAVEVASSAHNSPRQ